jgi:hypothetical protein
LILNGHHPYSLGALLGRSDPGHHHSPSSIRLILFGHFILILLGEHCWVTYSVCCHWRKFCCCRRIRQSKEIRTLCPLLEYSSGSA